MVSLCSLIRLIGVCADRDQPEFLEEFSAHDWRAMTSVQRCSYLVRMGPVVTGDNHISIYATSSIPNKTEIPFQF